ncbi:uncharacterized protein LOC141532086 [Cotesia typhae]|uniref:uncharacterized protein LOC141532086 n=1 Tax=Cotesia typhae TaxID=2053667 RepID=UPI003D69379B
MNKNSLGNDDNNFHIDSNNLSNDLDYNLSDVTEQKNKNDEFDSWMGKGTQPEKYDWMLMDTSDEDKTKFNEKIKHDFNYPLITNKDKHSSGIDIDGSTDNYNNNIEHSDYHVEDSSHDLENYNQSLEVGASYDIGCDLMNVIGSDLLNDIRCDLLNDIGCDLNGIETNS